MTYIITKSDISNDEIKARIRYIYDVFHIYVLVDAADSNKDYTVFKSIPESAIDLLLIVGHDKTTDEYLRTNRRKIQENNIAIISCNTSKLHNLKFFKNKNVFLPKEGTTINFYDGTIYGFDFDITDEEIILYRNRNENMKTMLKNTFEGK